MIARAVALLFTLSVPAIAAASGDGDGGHGGHGGPLTLDSLLHGDHSLELLAAFVNFGLLILIIRKLAAKPLGDHLAAQRKEVEDGMREAAEMKQKAEAAYKEYSERLETLDDEVEKLKSDIEAAAKKDKARIEEEAKAEAARIKADTEAMIERHAASLEATIRREVVEAAVEAAEQTLRKALTTDDQRKLADDFKARLESEGGAA